MSTSETSTAKQQVEELQAILDEVNALRQWLDEEGLLEEEEAELGDS